MIIYDNIHGYIELSDLATKIIDTPIFQRLRNIHQTGALYLVFPTATHTRFEHSIGTYYLAKQMISNIMKKQKELNITDEICELVSIAGLCHDLGHLLFSHLFDDLFLPKLENYKEIKEKLKGLEHHENRSIFLLDYMVTRYSILLNKDQLKVIGDLINPHKSEYNKWNSKYKVGKWIFQIISNPINSIDVDKFDYLSRDTKATGLKYGFNFTRIINDAFVINNRICYSYNCSEDIYQMFLIRYRLHRLVYNHKTVKSIEILITKLLFEFEKVLKISEYILDPEKMIDLVDSFIWNKFLHSNNNITNIVNNINQRKLPKLVYQDISISDMTIHNKILLDDMLKIFGKDSFEVIRYKVGYVSGNMNPLNHITFYNLKTLQIMENKVKDFSLLINQKFKEYFTSIYCTDLSLLDKFTEYFKVLQNNDN